MWIEDADAIWHGTNRAFRVDFITKPYKALKYCKFFNCGLEFASYAVYGTDDYFSNATKLVSESYPAGGISLSEWASVDISDYSMISLLMEDDGIFQYLKQENKFKSELSAIPYNSPIHAGMVNWSRGDSFPSDALPEFIITEPYLYLNRFCAIGVA